MRLLSPLPKLLISILLLVGTLPVEADGRANVYIVDDEGRPIKGAAISIVHSWLPDFDELLLLSDATGRFSFKAKALAIPYCIRIDASGYVPVRGQVWLAEKETVEFTFRTQKLQWTPALEHFNTGVVALNQGFADDAEKAFRRAIRADGDFAPARSVLAQILLDGNQPAKAARQAREALRIRPEDVRALGFLYESEKKLGDESAARDVLARLLEIGGYPPLAKRIYNEGVDKLGAGRRLQAKRAFADAILLYPGFVLAYIAEAEVALLENDYSAAAESLAQVLEIDPGNSKARLMSARIELMAKSATEQPVP